LASTREFSGIFAGAAQDNAANETTHNALRRGERSIKT
jgi:hypothetical protein